MTNNNFSNLLGCFVINETPSANKVLSYSTILTYDGTEASTPEVAGSNYPLSVYFQLIEGFGETNSAGTVGIFLSLGTDDTPPTRSDLKLGNSVEDFVWLSSSKIAGSNEFLIFNVVVKYKGSSPVTIREMGLNCKVFTGTEFLLAREVIEPLVINPNDTYSFIMRIK